MPRCRQSSVPRERPGARGKTGELTAGWRNGRTCSVSWAGPAVGADRLRRTGVPWFGRLTMSDAPRPPHCTNRSRQARRTTCTPIRLRSPVRPTHRTCTNGPAKQRNPSESLRKHFRHVAKIFSRGIDTEPPFSGGSGFCDLDEFIIPADVSGRGRCPASRPRICELQGPRACPDRPVDRNPPPPRALAGSASLSTSSARPTGHSTSCATRSQRRTVKARSDRCARITPISPRQSLSTVPGEFRHVTPWSSASLLRGRT